MPIILIDTLGKAGLNLDSNPQTLAPEYITEGKWVHVTGMEILTKGEDGNILRQVKVSKLSFDDFFEVKKPKLLRVPYKTAFFLETREQT